jgi:hypothetical protein
MPFVVGTSLFTINQFDVVVRGDGTAAVWVKAGVTCLVPLGVSNAGVLEGSRRPPSAMHDLTGGQP